MPDLRPLARLFVVAVLAVSAVMVLITTCVALGVALAPVLVDVARHLGAGA